MAIAFALVEATPYRLRYLCTQDGAISSPPVAADGFNTIPNDGGVTPDLLNDIASGAGPSPLRAIIRARLDGFPLTNSTTPIIPAGALNQAQARAIMNSDDNASAVLTNDLVGRSVVEITPRTGTISWSTDVNVDGQGDPTIEVRSDVGGAATAYVDVHFRHTYDL